MAPLTYGITQTRACSVDESGRQRCDRRFFEHARRDRVFVFFARPREQPDRQRYQPGDDRERQKNDQQRIRTASFRRALCLLRRGLCFALEREPLLLLAALTVLAFLLRARLKLQL